MQRSRGAIIMYVKILSTLIINHQRCYNSKRFRTLSDIKNYKHFIVSILFS